MKNHLNIVSTAVAIVHLLVLTAIAEPGSGQNAESKASSFERNLRVFVKLAETDSEIQSLFSKHDLTLQCTVNDLGLSCYIGIESGRLAGVFGKAAPAPQVVFLANASLLERLLNGEDCLSEMKVNVHMNVLRKLALKKDLARIRGALCRVYAMAARNPTQTPLTTADNTPKAKTTHDAYVLNSSGLTMP